ncbi:MAG: YdeI/OmpD-associated family protein [Candidatus Eremiobacteraeota bacterium]|nr:YdeI/OmpD-associated family protein [Candidatus Eremiobacteraeota bacterium]
MNELNPKPADAEPEPKVPTDFRKALADAPKAKTQWSDLTPIARRDFITWIDEAKQAETRTRRIERACSMLASGKRRPCCFSIVPLELHKALAASAKAKANWSGLTPTARRDLISWINSAKQRDARNRRVDETCVMLAAGKRRVTGGSSEEPRRRTP